MRRTLDQFCRRDFGVVTAFSDSTLRVLRRWLPAETGVRVISMGDLVTKALGLCGTIGPRVATPGQQLAAIREACNRLSSEGKLGPCDHHWGLHQAFAKTLRELRHYRVSSHDVSLAAEVAPEPMAARLRLISDVAHYSEAVLARSNREPGSVRLEWLLSQEPVSLGHEGPILCFRGDDNHPLYEEFLAWLVRGQTDVELTVPTLGPDRDLFHSSHRYGVEPPSRPSWWASLFTEGIAESPIEIAISETPDVQYEVEWALRDIQRVLMAGTAPTQIGLFVPNVQDYGPFISHTANRMGLGVATPFTVSILSNSLAHLIVATLEAILKLDPIPLIALSRSSYWRLSAEPISEITEAIRQARGQRSRAWEALTEWSKSGDDRHHLWVRLLIEWRTKWLGSQQSLWQWTESIREFTQIEWIATSVLDTLATSERDLRAHRAMIRTLEEYASMQSATEAELLGAHGFAALVRELWTQGVTVEPGQTSQSFQLVDNVDRLDEFEHLVVLGMLEGVFPRRRRQDPVLFDSDRAFLSAHCALSVPLPNSYDDARAERDRFVRLCASASKSAHFMFPQSDNDRDNIQAFYLAEIARLVPATQRTIRVRRELAPPEDLCTNPSDFRLAQALASEPEPPSYEALCEETVVKLAPRPGSEVRMSEIVEARRCPFRAGARRLDVHPSQRRTFARRLDDLFWKSNLPFQPDEAAALEAWLQALQRTLDESIGDLFPWEARMLECSSQRMAHASISREFDTRLEYGRSGGTGPTSVALTYKAPWAQYELVDKVQNLATASGYPVVQILERGSSVNYEDYSWLRYGLLAMARAVATNIRTVGIEVEDPGQRIRRMVVCSFKKSAHHFHDADSKSIKTTVLHQIFKRDGLLEVLKEEVNQGLDTLVTGDIQPQPNKIVCRGCVYAELCRGSYDVMEVGGV